MNQAEWLQKLVAGASELPPGPSRAAYLDSACVGDAALRAEAESLLESRVESRDDSPGQPGGYAGPETANVFDGDGDATRGEVDPASRERPGEMIGRYMLLQPIGEGGFGSVWMAEQSVPVGRRVALKIIKLGMDTRQVIARFEAERQALAMMDHPNIAHVLDAGATDAGRPYFVMELVAGKPIVEYCDGQNLTVRERLELVAQVCNAVQHAHQKGIIHRDLKPSNILVSTRDGKPSPKVIDFGVAKATSARLTDKTLFTEHRQMIGTPEYMSPEQADGSMDIDTRSDVYSLGVLLYELLAGSTPFHAAGLSSAAYGEVQRIIRDVEPPIPGARLSRSSDTLAIIAEHRRTEPRKLGLLIRGDLDWIVMKALEKDRARRYETASELALDIQRHLAGLAVIAAPPDVAYRVRKFVRRNRVAVSAGAAVAVALILGVAAFAWQATVAGRQRDLAILSQKAEARQRDAAERAAYQAQIVSAARAVEDQRMDAAKSLLAATIPRLRGWEYQHLASRLDRSLPSPLPADWVVASFKGAASSDAFAIRKTDGGGMRRWVVLDGDMRTERLSAPDTDYWSFELSPDGRRAIWVPSAPADRRPAAIWSVDSGTVIATFAVRPFARSGLSRSVTWSPDGDRLIICNGDGFEVHDGRTGELAGGRQIAAWADFTSDGRGILLHGSEIGSDSVNRMYQLLDSRTFEPTSDIRYFDSPVSGNSVAFWRSRVACPLADGSLHVFEIADGTMRDLRQIHPGIGVQTTAAWSRDGRLIAVGSLEGRVRVWESESGNLVGDFAGPQSPISSLMFLPGSGDLLACDIEGHHRAWPIGDAASSVLAAHRSFVYPIAISKGGGLLLTGGWDGYVGQPGAGKLWDTSTGTLVAEYGQPGEVFWSADLSPDCRLAVVGIWGQATSARRHEVIDLGTGAVVTTFTPPNTDSRPGFTVVHPDGRRAISTFMSGETFVWELRTGQILWRAYAGAPGPATRDAVFSKDRAFAAAVSPDGRYFAIADADAGIRLVDADIYADVRRWVAHSDAVWSLSFSPDGRQILSSSTDKTVGVWDVATGNLVARLKGHNAHVFCAAMSPDGTRIASGGRDGYLRLWDTKNYDNVAQLGGHKDYIFSLAWSPDGRQLFSGSGDGTVRIWDTRTLAERVAASRARAEALPAIEAAIAKARFQGAKPTAPTASASPAAPNPAGPADLAAAIESAIASPGLTPRQRELGRQVAAHFASRGSPAYYRAPRAATPIVIDGKLDDAAWAAAPWSEPFVDIEGDAKPPPRFETRVRMLWDDKYLYVAAKIQEPHVWGTLKNRDDIVFHDNDFEVFVDPDGRGRWYGEVEVNALGTIFDLRLDRPYSEQGNPHHDWSPPDMRAAVSIDGTLNDPADIDKGWTVEIAIPHAALADHEKTHMPPQPGDVWRINFSRVEWLHDIVDGKYVKRPGTKEDNWVWTPQNVVNMHVPAKWGFVELAGPGK